VIEFIRLGAMMVCLETSNGNWCINFDRRAESLGNAIYSAIENIESSNIGVKILKIEID